MENQKIPCELDAETALIGAILIDENLIIQVADLLSAEAFYDQRNKIIYQTMLDLQREGSGVDISVLLNYLGNHNKLEAAGGQDYIAKIADAYYTAANVDTYVDLINNAYIKRSAIYTLQNLSQDGFNVDLSAFDYIDKAEKAIFELSKTRRVQPFKKIENVVDTVFDMTSRMSEMTEEVIGIDTGFAPLNKYTQGFQPGQLIILAARPAMGKSAFAMNLATNVCQNNKNGNAAVALFSLEMSAEQICERMYACDASIRLDQIKNGRMTKVEWARFNNSKAKLKRYKLYFDDSANTTVSSIRAKCRKLKAEGDLDFIVIDYLGLIEGESALSKSSTLERVSAVTRGLKNMARELEVPVLALSQLSRKVEERDSKKPIMADLRDSGTIEQDADIVMFLYREEYYFHNSERKGEADLIIAKNRSGNVTSEDGIAFSFNGPFQRFSEKKEGN